MGLFAHPSRKVGLLPPDNLQTVIFAYKLYNRTDKQGIKLAANFKKEFCQDVKVEFVGVWYDSFHRSNTLELTHFYQGHCPKYRDTA